MYEKEWRVRKPNRLKGVEYNDNQCFFVTICTKEKVEIFGRIKDCVMEYFDTGEIVKDEINILASVYENVVLHNSIVMPNHVHLLVEIYYDETKSPTISQVIGQYKRAVTVKNGFSPWQKTFHEHKVRDEKAFNKISEYIENNVNRWQDDCYHPKRK